MWEVSELTQLVENISFYLTTLQNMKCVTLFISALVGNLNMEGSLSFFISSLHFMRIQSFICRYLKYFALEIPLLEKRVQFRKILFSSTSLREDLFQHLQILDHKMIYYLFVNESYSIWTQQVQVYFLCRIACNKISP